LAKNAEDIFIKKLAVSVLLEIIDIITPMSEDSEHAKLLLQDANFLMKKIKSADSSEEIKRRMGNFRDQVALRSDFMKEDVDSLADKQALYKLDMFTYKTASKSSSSS
jgi:hypothetical protein